MGDRGGGEDPGRGNDRQLSYYFNDKRANRTKRKREQRQRKAIREGNLEWLEELEQERVFYKQAKELRIARELESSARNPTSLRTRRVVS